MSSSKKINIRQILSASAIALAVGACSDGRENAVTVGDHSYVFNGIEKANFTEVDQKRIIELSQATADAVRAIMPELAPSIEFTYVMVDRDLSVVHGVSGRADAPDEIEISFSPSYAGGIQQAINDGLKPTLFHELHHTVRGWTISGNKFGRGIDIAAVNEGLADVFAEEQSHQATDEYPDDVNFDAWTKEILALPKNADYGEWMFAHPDGREAIGYRTGAYIIKRAIKNSNKTVLELSKLPVDEIYRLAGYGMKE